MRVKKATKADVATIVQIMQADLAKYVQLINNVYTVTNKQEGEDFVHKLQHDDIVYNFNALVQFMQDKNTVKLCDALMQQDTIVAEHFYSVVHYATDNYLYN